MVLTHFSRDFLDSGQNGTYILQTMYTVIKKKNVTL